MSIQSIAVVGGGPAGSVLAALLSKRGYKVGLIHDKNPTELFVGESLVPAIMPIIYELDIEEDMKPFSVYKPGASVWLDKNTEASVAFSQGEGKLVDYAYQTERKYFDKLLLDTAIKEGAKVVKGVAKLNSTNNNTIELSADTLSLFDNFFEGQPDFIIDASGRKRLIANLLKLVTLKGKRKDIALFAHLEGVKFDNSPGNIHMHRCDSGWSWRIPLKDKTSIGVVANKTYMDTLGTTAEEQFDNFIAKDSQLAPFLKGAKRTSLIQKYSNYQLVTKQLYGANWALIGDAAGFLDPVFSSGLYLAMTYAVKVANAIDAKQNYTFSDYQNEWHTELRSWKKMIEIWYNGRLFTNYKIGQDRLQTFIGKKIEPHVVKHFTRIFTGEAVNSKYSMWLLGFMCGSLQDFMKFFKMHPYDHKALKI